MPKNTLKNIGTIFLLDISLIVEQATTSDTQFIALLSKANKK